MRCCGIRIEQALLIALTLFPNRIYDFQVKATDRDEKSVFRYEIDGPQKDKNVFKIKPNTGVITTSEKLDFETKPKYNIQLKVWDSLTDPRNFDLSMLIVNVIDVNEPPFFTEPNCLRTMLPCQYTMEENKFAQIVEVKASDPDSATCSLTYEIVSLDKEYFDIDPKLGNIVTKRNGLDRELKSSYQIDVAVFDCGKPRLYEVKQIRLTVTDKNDNFPIFAQSYTKNVREDTQINSSILKVTATGKKRNY